MSNSYQKTVHKPDKLYSILPTVLELIGDVTDKTVLDLGCGQGFFTVEIAKKNPKKVIGMDNASKQIESAKGNNSQQANVEYKLLDIFKENLQKADVIVAPFVSNYSKDRAELKSFFENIFNNLERKGRLVLVVDLPNGRDLKHFGAIKKIVGEKKDGAKMIIELYNEDALLCTLNSQYFERGTFYVLLKEVGFNNIEWHKPVISQEGVKKLGADFWSGYTEDSELGYITAVK